MKIFNSIEDGCVSFVQYVKEINNGWSESDIANVYSKVSNWCGLLQGKLIFIRYRIEQSKNLWFTIVAILLVCAIAFDSLMNLSEKII